MPFHHRSRKRDQADGIDPSIFFGTPQDRGPDRKTYQLCKQAARALSFALAGECGDEVLRDALVDTVTPAPDASRLMVVVFPASAQSATPDAILERLHARKSVLRAAVAAAINRKRAPELFFCVGAPGGAR